MARKAIVKKEKTSLDTSLMERMARDAGKGVSKDAADNMVPLIYILQALSPQVQKRNTAYIEGAEPGAIWLRGINDPIVDGELGILFQPCFFNKDWVEWVPRDTGGGFVGRHAQLPHEAFSEKDARTNRDTWKMPNGNSLRETRYHAGLVHGHGSRPLPFVIPFSGSGHTVSRSWMFLMNSKQLPSGETAPSYGQMFKLRTKLKSNAMGEWYTWDVTDEGFVDSIADYEAGFALYNAFSSGERAAEQDEEQGEII